MPSIPRFAQPILPNSISKLPPRDWPVLNGGACGFRQESMSALHPNGILSLLIMNLLVAISSNVLTLY